MAVPKVLALRARRLAKAATDATLGSLAVASLRLVQTLDRRRLADLAGGVMRRLGPVLKEHAIGRANLAAAFPEKSTTEIDHILHGVWDNLGRIAAEFAHLDRFTVLDPAFVLDPALGAEAPDIVYAVETHNRFQWLRRDGKPALIFAAHLANWELPALVAARYQLDLSVLYRRPNIAGINDAIMRIRKNSMGSLVPSSLDAPLKLGRLLEAGGHVAMLVDQYDVNGIDVTFFGRRCKANPFIARLARHVECPIHGARMVRLSDPRRFRIELTEAVEPARDRQGRIDVAGTMQIITSIVESWVREHPEQWLWVHRRWR